MRDIIFAVIMAVLIPASFVRPWIGILGFAWLGYMNPHQYCYWFARWDVPWSEMVAIATLAGWAAARERQPFVLCRETILMILLWIWFAITTVFAFYPEDAVLDLKTTSKILLMTLLTIPLMQERARMRWLLLVIVVSIGFYGFKSGYFVMNTGGNAMVEGAPGRTSVSSNNAIALALNMCLPLFWYLRKDEPRRWVRRALLATFWLSAITVPFCYSRGGVLGLACVLTILCARSKRRYLAFPILCLGAVLLFAVAPEKWVTRMQTMEDYEKDTSAMSRLTAWGMSIDIANENPLFGGGFNTFNRPETYARYRPELGRRATDAHSIYFNLLGEHGYVGLGLFIVLVFCTFGSLHSVFQVGRRYKELSWVSDYSYMLGASISTYLVTGAFLSAAYFDLAWQLFALVVVLKAITKREVEALAPVRSEVRPMLGSNPRLGKTLPIRVPAGHRSHGPGGVVAGTAGSNYP